MRRTVLKGMIGGWSAGQVAGFVKDFVSKYPYGAWYLIGEDARDGLVAKAVMAIVFSQSRADEGDSIVIDDMRALRDAFEKELAERYLMKISR